MDPNIANYSPVTQFDTHCYTFYTKNPLLIGSSINQSGGICNLDSKPHTYNVFGYVSCNGSEMCLQYTIDISPYIPNALNNKVSIVYAPSSVNPYTCSIIGTIILPAYDASNTTYVRLYVLQLYHGTNSVFFHGGTYLSIEQLD